MVLYKQDHLASFLQIFHLFNYVDFRVQLLAIKPIDMLCLWFAYVFSIGETWHELGNYKRKRYP